MSSANRYRFTSSFPIRIPFISFAALMAVARTSKNMFWSSGKSGHPCLVPDLSGNFFNFSSLRMRFAVGLSYMSFSMLWLVPSVPTFLSFFFNQKWVLDFVKAFFCVY